MSLELWPAFVAFVPQFLHSEAPLGLDRAGGGALIGMGLLTATPRRG